MTWKELLALGIVIAFIGFVVGTIALKAPVVLIALGVWGVVAWAVKTLINWSTSS